MDDLRIRLRCGAVCGKYIYASCHNMNGLFRVSLETHVAEFLNFFNDEEIDAKYLHCEAIEYNNNIYFIPDQSKCMHIYDVKKNQIRCVSFQEHKKEGGYVSCIVDNKLWLFSKNHEMNVYIIDLLNESVAEWSCSEIAQSIFADEENEAFPITHIVNYKNKILLPGYGMTKVFEIDTQSYEVVTHNLHIDGIIGCFKGGNNGIWILSNCGNGIHLWDYSLKKIRRIIENKDMVKPQKTWNWVIETDRLYAIPAHGKEIMSTVDENCISIYNVDRNECGIGLDELLFYTPIVNNKKVVLLPLMLDKILILNEGKVEVIQVAFQIADSIKEMYLEYIGRNTLKEGELIGLKGFFGGMVHNQTAKKEEACGMQLWKELNG